jgi:hypothetical protein
MLMRTLAKIAVTVSLILAGASAGTAMAADEAKPAAPSLSDVLGASGITATGYVDGTASFLSTSPPGGSSYDTNTFALNQASLTLAYVPAAGFGATVQAVGGTEAANGCYQAGYGACGGTSNFNLLQAYAQYVSGKTTLYVGKFTTLAGAEVAAPTGNTNVTRSLLYWYNEPVTHVGARLAVAATDTVTVTGGINNGWNNDLSSSGKTYEVGATFAPSKAFTLAAAGYFTSKDPANDKRSLIDVVATFNLSSQITVILSGDYDKVDFFDGSSAKWYGVAGYFNYAIDDAWRLSARAEYLDDKDGYATTAYTQSVTFDETTRPTKVTEGTVTVGFAPSKNFEVRAEGRYDTYKVDVVGSVNTTQLWLQALYKF